MGRPHPDREDPQDRPGVTIKHEQGVRCIAGPDELALWLAILAGHNITWRQLVTTEPRLECLLEDATSTEPGEADQAWYGYGDGGLKERMSTLVGFHADDPRLQTMEAYTLATNVIYGALPDDPI